MAKQEGLLSLKGQIGKLTFYKTRKGYEAKQSKGMLGNRIRIDPRFIRVRENAAEFGRACRANKTLRRSFQYLVRQCGDSQLCARLTQLMMKVLKADEVNDRGLRTVKSGPVELLQDFQFNLEAPLDATLSVAYTTAIDRKLGKLTVSLPGFDPGKRLHAPPGATHFQIISGGAALDFAKEGFEASEQFSPYLPINGPFTGEVELINQVSPNNAHVLVLVMGIVFFQEVKSRMHPLQNLDYNSLAVVAVEGI